MRKVYKTIIWWPLALVILALLSAGAYFILKSADVEHDAVLFVMIGGCIVFAAAWFILVYRHLVNSLTEASLETGENLQLKMENLEFPYAILTTRGEFIWKNEAFRHMLMPLGRDAGSRVKRIGEIFPDLAGEHTLRTKEPEYVSLGDRTYRVTVGQVMTKMPLITLLLQDETGHLSVMQELMNQKNVAGLVYVDNFEEVIKTTEPEHQGFLTVLVEQKITRYFQRFSGVVCQLQKDRYFVSLDAKALAGIREDRFSLLDDVKSVKAGNEMVVTVSMAFGGGGASYDENYTEAQNAMDLALGRGGDQAIVKYGPNTEYFGGKSIGEASQTRVKARVKAQALRELLVSCDQVFIMGHPGADNDSFGAAVGMFRAAAVMEKPAHIILGNMAFSVRPLLERFKKSSNYPQDMFVSARQALSSIGENAMVIVVDANRPSYTECPEILSKAKNVVVFDHHRQMTETISATLSYVEPYASSACELVTELLQYFRDDLKLRALEAEAIYTGIVVDTNNFADRTGVRTFDAAAYLKRSGADLIRVKKLLRDDFGHFMARTAAQHSAELYRDGFIFAECQAAGLDSPSVVGAQAANELLNIDGIKASFVLTNIDGTVFISARSIDEMNVQLIMERIGGGGHINLAGAQLKNTSVQDAVRLLKETIDAMLAEGTI